MISFIIVNYKSAKELKRCLNDLSKMSDARYFEVIIVNNDENKLSLPRYTFKKQHHCEINKNIGYGAANNYGLNFASEKYVCFLNPDTFGFENNLLDILDFTNEKTITSPRLLTETGESQQWSCGEKITLLEIIKNNFGIHKKPWLNNTISHVDWVSGAALFVQTKTIRDLGGFDESFFLYYEDVDLCQRIQNIGGSTLYIPHVTITHSCGNSSKKDRKNQKKWYYKSQDIFFKKHVGVLQLYLLRTLRFFHK